MANAFVNETAESAVLYAILTDPKQKDRIVELTKADFYKQEHQKLFSALQSMYLSKKEIDMVTMTAVLAEMFGKESRTLEDAMMGIMTNFSLADAWQINSHVEILKACALRRRVYLIVNGAQKDLENDSEDVSAVLEKVRQQLRDVVVARHAWKPIAEVMMDTYAALEKKARGEELSISSSIPALDGLMAGFHHGELTIIGARPAVGKSALGAQFALAAARNGYKVGIISREMTSVQYGTRIIASGADVDAKKLRSGNIDPDDWVRVAHAVSLYSQANVNFLFSAKYVEDIRMEAQRLVDSGDLDMLVIDYVQLLQTKQRFDKDYLRIAYISKMLKDMTTDFNISIIGLAQVNRSAENTMPTLAELRGAGDLEQDADNVIFMHRPRDMNDPYVRPADKPIFESIRRSGLQYMVLKVAKQRQGETGSISTIFNPQRMRFTTVQLPDAPSLPSGDENDNDDTSD